jgi:hypothetical protein
VADAVPAPGEVVVAGAVGLLCVNEGAAVFGALEVAFCHNRTGNGV